MPRCIVGVIGETFCQPQTDVFADLVHTRVCHESDTAVTCMWHDCACFEAHPIQ